MDAEADAEAEAEGSDGDDVDAFDAFIGCNACTERIECIECTAPDVSSLRMFTQRPSRLPSSTISWLIGGAANPNPHTWQISRGNPNRPPSETPFDEEFDEEFDVEFAVEFAEEFAAEFAAELPAELPAAFPGPSRRRSTSRSVLGFPREKHCMEARSRTSAGRAALLGPGMCLKQSANRQGCLPPPM